MKMSEIRGKSDKELGEHIVDLRREQFSLRMQKAQGSNTQTHQFKRTRREIARAKTALNEKK